MARRILSVFKDKRGVSALEYSILAGIVVLGLVTVYNASGVEAAIAGVLQRVTAALNAMTT